MVSATLNRELENREVYGLAVDQKVNSSRTFLAWSYTEEVRATLAPQLAVVLEKACSVMVDVVMLFIKWEGTKQAPPRHGIRRHWGFSVGTVGIVGGVMAIEAREEAETRHHPSSSPTAQRSIEVDTSLEIRLDGFLQSTTERIGKW